MLELIPLSQSSLTTVGLVLVTLFLIRHAKRRRKPKVSIELYGGDPERNNNSAKPVQIVEVTHFDDMPGPIGLPIFGSAIHFGKFPHEDLLKWSKLYGPVFRMKLGAQNVVVVTGSKLIREALVKQGTAFAGRADLLTSKFVCGGRSLSFSTYSANWKLQKAKARKALNLYTSGVNQEKRMIMEETAFEQANNLVNHLLKTTEPQFAAETARQASANVICMICFGVKWEYDNPTLIEALKSSDAFDDIMGTMNVVNFCPWMAKIPGLKKPYERFINYMDYYNGFVAELLNKTWNTYDETNLRHATDCLRYEINHGAGIIEYEDGTLEVPKLQAEKYADKIRDQEQSKQNGQPKQVKFKMAVGEEERVIRCTQDIYGAGFETMATAFEWMILYLAVFEDIQDKLSEEVNRLLAPDETPSLRKHGDTCIYVHSFMTEFLRHCCMFPLPLPHCTTRATHLGGYHIPKGNVVFFNFFQANRNPEIWDDPNSFRPERFIKEDEDGNLILDKKKQNLLITFGLGARRCLGEMVAKNELFIFICTLTRHCKFEPYIQGEHPKLPWPLYPKLTIAPQPFKVVVTKRELTK